MIKHLAGTLLAVVGKPQAHLSGALFGAALCLNIFPTGSNPVWDRNCRENATNHSGKYLNLPPLVKAMFMHMTGEGTLGPW